MVLTCKCVCVCVCVWRGGGLNRPSVWWGSAHTFLTDNDRIMRISASQFMAIAEIDTYFQGHKLSFICQTAQSRNDIYISSISDQQRYKV